MTPGGDGPTPGCADDAEDRPYRVATRDRPPYRLVRARGYVDDHRHELAFVSDVTERVLETFEAEGIETARSLDLEAFGDPE